MTAVLNIVLFILQVDQLDATIPQKQSSGRLSSGAVHSGDRDRKNKARNRSNTDAKANANRCTLASFLSIY